MKESRGIMRIITGVALAAAAAFSTQAAAATFSGSRAEIRGGWDRTTLSLSYEDAVDSLSGSGHKSGFDIGAEVGYDYAAAGTLVIGAYAGIEGATTKDCSPVVGDDKACLKLGRNFTVGARAGAQVAPLVMVYVKGGYSNGQLRATYSNIDDPTLNFADHSNRGGIHFGAGVEAAVGQGYVRAEYVRTNYNGYHYVDPDFRLTMDGHRDQVLLGFGMRF
jgi:outer membrane immunogenic protein